jgi:hypothetical protein
VHYPTNNTGFDRVLDQIAAKEINDTMCVVIGGDLVDKGTTKNYDGFVARCEKFFNDTKIPVIPGIGNHEFYGVSSKGTEIDRYRQKIGRVNFPIEISDKGLPKSLTLVAFNDAKPRKPVKISIPDRSNNCSTITQDYKSMVPYAGDRIWYYNLSQVETRPESRAPNTG